MSCVDRIKKSAKTAFKVTRFTLATVATLVFGATMVWGGINALDGVDNLTFAAGETTSWCLGHEAYCTYTPEAGVHDTACTYDSDKDRCRLKTSLTSFNITNDPCSTDEHINIFLQIGSDSVLGVTQKEYEGDDYQWCQAQGFTVGGAHGMENKIVTNSKYWCTSFQWDNEDNEYRMGYIGDQGDVCWDAWSEEDGFRSGCNAPYSGATTPEELDWDCTVDFPESEVKCEAKDIVDKPATVSAGDTIDYTVQILVEEESVEKIQFYDDYDETKIQINNYNGQLYNNGWRCALTTIEDNNKVILCKSTAALANFDTRKIEPGVYTLNYSAIVREGATGTIHNEIINLNALISSDTLEYSEITISEDCQEDIEIEEEIEETVAINCVDKTVSPQTVLNTAQSDKEVEYTVTVSVTEGELDHMTVYDNYDESKVIITQYPDANDGWQCGIESGQLVCNSNGAIEPLQVGEYTITYKAQALEGVYGEIRNSIPQIVGTKGENEYIWNNSNTQEICSATFTATAETKPFASCNYKEATQTTVKPLDVIDYEVQLEVANSSIDRLEFIDDYDQTKVTIDNSLFSGLSMNGWDCTDNGDVLSCHTNERLNTVTFGTYKINYQARVKSTASGNIENKITNVYGYVDSNNDGNFEVSERISNVLISPECQETVIIKIDIPEEKWSCDNKYSNKDGEILNPGDELTYYIKYTAEDLTDYAVIEDYLPEGFHVTNLPDNCDQLSNTNLISCEANNSGIITIEGYIDENFEGNQISNTASMWYAGTESYEQCNTISHTIEQIDPEIECSSKVANKTEVEVGDTIEYTVTTTLTRNNADELIIVDDFDESKVEIDTFNTVIESENPNDEIMLDCNIEDRNGNGVLVCSARMFEGEGKLETGEYTLRYTATVLEEFASGDIFNTIIETTVIRNREEFSDENPEDSCYANVEIIEPEISCEDKVANKTTARKGELVNYTVSFTLNRTDVDYFSFVDNYDETKVSIIENSWFGNLDINCTDENGVLNCTVTNGNQNIEPGTYSFDYQARVTANITDIAENRITSVTAHKNNESFFNDDTEGNCSAEIQLVRNEPNVDCIEKVVEPAENIKVGDIVKFTVHYSSINQDGNIWVEDMLNPEFYEFIEFDEDTARQDCSFNNDLIGCNLPGNAEGFISYYVRIIKSGALENLAYVEGMENNDICEVNFTARELEEELICISKVADDQYVKVGDEINFTIRYQNTGETVLSGIELVDQLPIGISFLSSEDNCYLQEGYVGTGDNVKCVSDVVLEPGDSETFVIRTKVNEYAPAGMRIQNRIAHLSSGDIIGDVSECYENIYIDLPEPQVSITKETIDPESREIILGENENDYVVFNLKITNEGPTTLVHVPVIDLFNLHDFSFISADPEITSIDTYNSTTILYWENIGELASKESREITVILKAKETYWDDVYGNVLWNTARVQNVIDENGSEANEDQAEDYVKIIGSILGEELEYRIEKKLLTENPTKAGKEVTFLIQIWNVGDKDISEIKFVDDYDSEYLTFVDFSKSISHNLNLYQIDSIGGKFIHENILSGKGELQPGGVFEFEVTFLSEEKNGETTNWATAYVEDEFREDNANVRIVVETLADTGSNIIIPVMLGIILLTLTGKKIVVKRKKK